MPFILEQEIGGWVGQPHAIRVAAAGVVLMEVVWRKTSELTLVLIFLIKKER